MCASLFITFVRSRIWCFRVLTRVANLGVDVYICGTVAAVREAAMHGIPGIAISHGLKAGCEYDWDVATRWTSRVLADLLNREPKSGCFWNVNFAAFIPGKCGTGNCVFATSTQPLPGGVPHGGRILLLCGRVWSARSRGGD